MRSISATCCSSIFFEIGLALVQLALALIQLAIVALQLFQFGVLHLLAPLEPFFRSFKLAAPSQYLLFGLFENLQLFFLGGQLNGLRLALGLSQQPIGLSSCRLDA